MSGTADSGHLVGQQVGRTRACSSVLDGWRRGLATREGLLRAYVWMVVTSAVLLLACCAVPYAALGREGVLRLIAWLALLGCGHAVMAAYWVAGAIAGPWLSAGANTAWDWAFWMMLAPYLLALFTVAIRVLPRRPAEGFLVLMILGWNATTGYGFLVATVAA